MIPAVTRGRLRIATLAARLVDEPFCVPLDQIGRLTLWQVNHVYFHARDKQGHLVAEEDVGPVETWEQQVKGIWRARGLPGWRVDQKWAEYLKQQQEAG